MLRLSKKVEYALIAMTEMVGNGRMELMTAKALSQKYHIPAEILGKILQKLTKECLLLSEQGVKGGYRLGGKPEDISVRRVVEAIEGPLSLISCSGNSKCACAQLSSCNIRSPMRIMEEDLINYFDRINLQDLHNRHKATVGGGIESVSNPFLNSTRVEIRGE
ncbi:MAG: Rrf2 family transcriptional regulator [Caldithrix sp.]|nr:Rrf2 family transcriptional regulator [Caldithrix sp.]